ILGYKCHDNCTFHYDYQMVPETVLSYDWYLNFDSLSKTWSTRMTIDLELSSGGYGVTSRNIANDSDFLFLSTLVAYSSVKK
ncbi:hypothetical protein STEG23_022469, partial [Scotinomys teguina]